MTDRLSSAKLYYFLAMRDAILELGDQFYDCDVVHQSIVQKYPQAVEQATQFLKSDKLFRICLEDFIRHRWVDSIDDEFASLFIRKNDRLIGAPGSTLRFKRLHDKYESLGSAKEAWLSSALVSVLDSFDTDELNEMLPDSNLMEATEPDDKPDTINSDDWSPIPLDRSDSEQTAALEALEKTIEELRGDNGYAATHPEEKAFVQDKLSAVAKRLREDSQISWMYLREFAFKPLGIVIRRFGGAAVGLVAATAKESLKSWLKSKGISFLDDVIK